MMAHKAIAIQYYEHTFLASLQTIYISIQIDFKKDFSIKAQATFPFNGLNRKPKVCNDNASTKASIKRADFPVK
jgi:hypothetical protein